jgi:hypothetical protein
MTTKKLKKRTSCYIQKPYEYEITCNKCGGTNIDWSEYEGKIWCFDCKKDVKGTEGVFGGPIPIECAALLGMSFDRFDLVKKCILRYDDKLHKYVPLKNKRELMKMKA